MKKPLHKHIGQQAKKVRQRFTKYLYERDTIFATLWVFLFIVGLGAIPLNLGFLNPIKLGLKDFDFNDISYSKLGKGDTSKLDRRMIIINIGQADREGLARLIEKTAAMKPRVIGLDVLLDGPREPYKDSLLSETFKRHKNLVAAAKFQLDSTDQFTLEHNYFLEQASHAGYVNFPNDERESTRFVFPIKKNKDTTFYSFSSTLLKLYDPVAFKRLEKKGDQKLIINYSRRSDQYLVVEGDDILMDNVDSTALEGKIALLAYVGSSPFDIEDKKFTPMNDKYYGKSFPDMNGIVVHANIISMALDDDFVKKVPLWMNLLIAIVVCWLHMSFFIRYYLESHIWFHLIAKLAQVASAIFFVWLGIYLFDRYRLKVDLKMSLIVIILAVDVIYFYEAWAVWMNKKFNYQTVFKPHHH